MTNIKVVVYDPTGISKEVELPSDMTMRDLIPRMVNRMELPSQDSDGNQLTYHLKHHPTGHTFIGADTLSGVGVKAGDPLEVFPSIVGRP